MIDKICKLVITTYKYINEIQYDKHRPPYFRVTDKRKKMAQKALKKMLSYMKDSKYYEKRDRFNYRYYDYIEEHLNRSPKDESNSIYLTWIQYQLHQFIHQFCNDYDPNNTDSKEPVFYNECLETLLR